MRSITATLLVDLLRRGWLVLPAAALAMFVLPAGVYTALRNEGGLEPDDPAQVMMYYVFVQFGWVALFAALGKAQGNPSRFFTYPVSTPQIVAGLMFHAMLVAFVITAASSALVNLVLDHHWPIWGPAVFGAVVIAATQAAIWLSGKSLWVLGILTGIVTLLAVWFKLRHGPLIGMPGHYWDVVTVSETATLLLTGLAAYGLGVWAVTRARRGDGIPELGFVAWVERVLEDRLAPGPFRSREEAQRWYLWRKAGYFMPAATLFLGLCGIVTWLLASREAQGLWVITMIGPVCLGITGFLGGMILGNHGPDDASYALGQFLGTRPMTTAALSRAALLTLTRGIGLAWLMWVAAVLAVALSLWLAGANPPDPREVEISWAYIPGALIAGWAAAAGMMVLGLTGRTLLPVTTLMIAPTSVIALINAVRWTLPESAEPTAFLWLAVVASLICVAVAGWSVHRALASGFISPRTALLCGGAWLLLSVAVLGEQALRDMPSPVGAALGVGVMALAVLPVSATPVALSWNRVR